VEFRAYQDAVETAARLTEAGKHQSAADVLEDLITRDISDLDNSVMCVNLATVYDHMGQNTTALTWYDRAIEYERPHNRFWATESKAAYLAKLKRHDESRRLYEVLLERRDLTEADRHRITHNLQALTGDPS
jgi:tetratricopeptide (TPR) repeat protein